MFDVRKMQEQALYDAVRRRSDDETAGEIVFGRDGTARAESDPVWVESTMCRLEQRFDDEAVKEIRMGCQCGYGMEEKLALLRELMAVSSSMEEFAGSEKARAAGLFCEGGQLYLQFAFCPCPMLAKVQRLRTLTWCACSAGYSKALFEKAFGCAVEVTLLESIKHGDSRCLMRIVPQEPVWA
jgi:predicted hydrocarbon binding protein